MSTLARTATAASSKAYSAAPSVAEDREIRALLQSRPMTGLIRICMTREPSFESAAQVEGIRHATFVDRDPRTQRVVALGTRSVRPVYFGGEPVLVGYLGQLRTPEHAAGLKRLRAGFEHLEASRRADELPFDITTVVSDNRPARRLLERGLSVLPTYRALGSLDTLVLATREHLLTPKVRLDPRLRSATLADLPGIERRLSEHNRRYDFAPVWTSHDLGPGGRARDLSPTDFVVLEDDGKIIACAALWDQRRFKQTLIAGYAPWLGRTRHLVNLGLTAVGQPRLPRENSALAMAYVSHLAAPDVESAVMLIAALKARARARGLEQLAITLAHADERRQALKRAFAPRSYESILYQVTPRGREVIEPSGRHPYLEAATL